MNSDTIRFMMRNVIAAHNRSKFEIYGYSPAPPAPDIRNAFDVIKDTRSLDNDRFVTLVRRDKIDVFVELSGFSPGHRFTAMAWRCAPVQISYLNHTGTSGIAAVDYILSDEISTPTDSHADRTFTETIYRLPGCLMCFDYRKDAHPHVSDPPSLKRGYVTFGCFGSGGKINIDLIEMWADLLHRVPGSMFYIRNGQLSAPDNRRFLADCFLRYGIGQQRLRIEGGTDRTSLLRSYAHVDITMDTWPYCGGNTVAESLWQGVPVVTYMGSRMSARYGAALLTVAGCADLIGHSVDEYINVAVQLACQPQRLTTFRNELRRMCEEHGLADSIRFARNLERAYGEMLRQRCKASKDVNAAVA
jgi:predicted O-linked N-acetylglucosamine transferase (SPINDLY family)